MTLILKRGNSTSCSTNILSVYLCQQHVNKTILACRALVIDSNFALSSSRITPLSFSFPRAAIFLFPSSGLKYI